MKLVGYGRVSTHKQEASLDDQRTDIESFCNSTDEYQHGGEHDLVEWFEDEGESGSILTVRRPGFRDLIDYVTEHDDVDGIVIWDFDRFGREPIDQLSAKFILEEYEIGRHIEVLQVEPWADPYRAIPPVTTSKIKETDRPLDEWNNLFLFMTQSMMDMRELLEISHRTKRSLRLKEERGEPRGRTPRGLMTDKQLLDRSEATVLVPDPDTFQTCIRALNTVEHSDSFYEAGNDLGFDKPHTTVKRMWEQRTKYLEALEAAREDEEIADALPFDPDDIFIGF